MPRRAAHEALQRVRRNGRARAADEVDSIAKGRGLAPRDHDLARELALGVLRVQGALDAVLVPRLRRRIENQAPRTLDVLRLGAYQLLCLDRIPARAAVHSSVELARESGARAAAGFVNAVLRAVAARVRGPVEGDCPLTRSVPRPDGGFTEYADDVFPAPAADLPGHLAARWAHPRWLVERMLEQHGEEGTRAWLASGVRRPVLALRPSAGREQDLAAALSAADISHEPEGRCLLVDTGRAIPELPGYEEGWFAVQGPTAAEVVPALAPHVGDGVLDLCAAPGGKTVALAEAVGTPGTVLAVDRSERRLAALRAEVARRGFENVAAVAADATDAASLPAGLRDPVSGATCGFDAAVVDVPCSNTGVLGRRVEARHRLEGPQTVEHLAAQAARLLNVAILKVRPGGRVAYSTCSIDRAENDDVVERVLTGSDQGSAGRGPRATVVRRALTFPVAGRRDGGFVAVLEVR